MSKIDYKELTDRVVKLTDRLNAAMNGESIAVCLHALAFATANLLVSYSKTGSSGTEEAAKVFYKDLMRNVKGMEQSKAHYDKAN